MIEIVERRPKRLRDRINVPYIKKAAEVVLGLGITIGAGSVIVPAIAPAERQIDGNVLINCGNADTSDNGPKSIDVSKGNDDKLNLGGTKIGFLNLGGFDVTSEGNGYFDFTMGSEDQILGSATDEPMPALKDNQVALIGTNEFEVRKSEIIYDVKASKGENQSTKFTVTETCTS